MTKDQIISALLLNEIASGKSVSEAVDFILGEGTYETLACEIFDRFERTLTNTAKDGHHSGGQHEKSKNM